MLRDYEKKTIAEIRENFPQVAKFLDNEIADCYVQYCEMFHGAAWTKTDLNEFVNWATSSPLDAIRAITK
jgi:hypothetical protein